MDGLNGKNINRQETYIFNLNEGGCLSNLPNLLSQNHGLMSQIRQIDKSKTLKRVSNFQKCTFVIIQNNTSHLVDN